ncbi:MAG: glycerol-3-phosphate dehydrogenase/oxidase [Deltaproteobacteria bacterium]|nr:glycerol-3-phosphate dehydrogenase/oxidase [Deltaproteobacteria bacterium]
MRKLERNTVILSSREYDLIIVGGGIFGVCAAWDAALRGLSVALIDKGDFANATSSNHFKMVHGGIRYLQHGDIARIRESSRERSALLRIAPHLVKPLPIVIPTYGHGVKGKAFLGCGLLLYDLLTLGRNRGIQKDRMIPRGQFISRKEVLDLFPGLEKKGLTGGAIFCDGQVYNPPRLAISFLRSAVHEGTDAANYVEARGFLREKDRIVGINARDLLTGDDFDIRGKWVLNTAGPWAHRLLESGLGLELHPRPTFSRDLAFVVGSRINHGYALAFSTQAKDADSIVDIGGRRLFAVPWRNYTLIGVWHRVFEGVPETIYVTEAELKEIIHEVNTAYPGLQITFDDIRMINMGLTLFGSEDHQANNNMSFGKRSIFINHRKEHGIDGITTLIGVRATNARGMAEKAINIILDSLGKRKAKSKTEYTPIYGGNITCLEDLIKKATQKSAPEISPNITNALIRNYGSRYEEILKYIDENSHWAKVLRNSTTLEAEVIHAVREEMAQKLTDVVFRRTDLCSGGSCENEVLQRCAQLAAGELGWDDRRLQQEIEEVNQVYPQFLRKKMETGK